MANKKPVLAAPWAYSKLHAFETCPKQFYHEKVLREFPYTETDAIRYGNEFHKAAEDYVGDDVPLPKKFSEYESLLTKLKNKPGDIRCEFKFGITEDLNPCGFFGDNVWYRGVVDYMALNKDRARIVDYKTGAKKSVQYADKGQLELMALGMFTHFPEINTVNAALLYVIGKAVITDTYTRDDMPDLWARWLAKFGRMSAAFDSRVWNPKPSGLCAKHCPVLDCAHNGRN